MAHTSAADQRRHELLERHIHVASVPLRCVLAFLRETTTATTAERREHDHEHEPGHVGRARARPGHRALRQDRTQTTSLRLVSRDAQQDPQEAVGAHHRLFPQGQTGAQVLHKHVRVLDPQAVARLARRHRGHQSEIFQQGYY